MEQDAYVQKRVIPVNIRIKREKVCSFTIGHFTS